ncbi:MAG: amidohydrolase family protein [Thermoplasmata archaeon]|jgi:5-methylthioadenosine/S-adenosylhomocysteine deaminase|nr:amidohydrolase family protein [Thermoplasmatales archaeon]PMP73242.1 MAG: metal-dependent hydrolase [Aciduliprofundum sp.]HEU13199.1 metal-dependent hydrolase [Euryarchaeota archaeon]
MSILIKGGMVVTQNLDRKIMDADIYIDENFITEINRNISVEADHVIDARNRIVMPGLINTHTHVGMSMFRGAVEDMQLDRFLEKTFKLDAQRTEEDIYYSSLLSMAEMIRTGTTSFLDLYYDEHIVARAVEKSGMRGFLSWVTLDREFTTQKGEPLKNAEEFISSHRGKERVVPSIGFQGVYVCSDETLLKGKEIAERYGVIEHMHLSETRKEVYDYLKKKNKRPVEHLKEINFLSNNLVAAHTVWLTVREIDYLGQSGVSVSHNPVSNMKLGTGGAAPVPEMMKRNVNVTLGTDSSVTNNNLDMFDVMKTAGLMHKNDRWDASVLPSQSILDFATINAAKALKVSSLLGSIEEGKLADIIILDPFPSGIPLKKENIVANIVYALKGLNVTHTIVDGRILMSSGVIRSFDVGEVLSFMEKI